jgi:hypothetical protein
MTGVKSILLRNRWKRRAVFVMKNGQSGSFALPAYQPQGTTIR